ncbi:MAG: hypothetical protein HDR22_02795 [Lachnospiraceae bacterium]|nr:hypothetical protein [Lachnospiraceae bacterium]
MEREKNAKKVLDRLDKRKKTYIFGAGAVGNGMAKALEQCNFISTDQIVFLVNDGKKRENEEVLELSECKDNLEDCNVIYAIQSDEKSIYEKLVKRKNVNDIIFVNIDTLTGFFALSYEELLKENNISFTDKFIDCNGVKIINPLLMNKSLVNTFYAGLGDIILPECMGDYSRAEEGAYINGKVNIEKGDVIIDCGANIGLFTAVAAARGERSMLLSQ